MPEHPAHTSPQRHIHVRHVWLNCAPSWLLQASQASAKAAKCIVLLQGFNTSVLLLLHLKQQLMATRLLPWGPVDLDTNPPLTAAPFFSGRAILHGGAPTPAESIHRSMLCHVMCVVCAVASMKLQVLCVALHK